MAQPDINAWAARQLGDAAAPAPTPATPTFTPDADVNVIAPDGQAGTVKGHSLDSFLRAGYQLEDSAATNERVLERKYGDAPLAAGALGVARGVTFGVSDLVARGLGERESVAALERFNPVASTIGEVGGALGASFIPGLGLAGDLGHAAQEATAGSTAVRAFAEGGKFAKVAARYAPVLARGAAEGGLYGAGGGLSQAALSEDPMTAEAVLGDIASGALLGAGTGMALEAGGQFLRDSAAWAKAAHVEAAAASTAEAEAVPSAIPTQEGASTLAEGSGPVRTAPREPPPDHVVEDFKTKYHRMTVASRQNVRQFEGLVAKGAATPEMEAALADLEAARAKSQSLLPTEGSADASRTYEVHEKTGKQGRISREMWTADNAGVAEAAQRPEFQQALAEHQAALDRAQAALGNKPYPPVIEANHPIFDVSPARNGLNPQATELLDSLSRPAPAKAAVGRKVLGNDAVESIFGVKGATKAEEAAAETAGRGLLPEAKTAGGGHARGHGINTDTPMGYLKSSAIHHASTGVAHGVASNIAMLLGGTAGAWRVGPAVHHKFEEVFGDGPIAHGLSYVAGGLAGIPIALAASFLVRRPMNAALRRLLSGGEAVTTGVAGRAAKGMGRVASAVDSIIAGKGSNVTRRVATAVLAGTSFALARPEGPAKPKGSAFQQRADEMSHVMANPTKARTAIHENLAGIRAVDPMLSDQMEELAFARLMFLGEKMPRDPGAGSRLGRRAPWHPTDTEVSRWARYVDAAEHPEHVLHAVADGTVTMEQVETLERLYPTTYERVRSDIVARAAELQASLPWDKRLSLSVLFHQPVDDILQPQNVAAMQKTFVQMDAQKQDGVPSPMTSAVKPPQPTPAQQRAAGH